MKSFKKTRKNKCNILIVDDHPIVRQGITTLINQESDLIVSGEAENASDALKFVAESKPDLAIIDLSLGGQDGIELIKELISRHGPIPILVLSMHGESLFAERALRAGATGYIMKQEATEKVITAIRIILNGEIYLSKHMVGKTLQKFMNTRPQTFESAVESLSDRQLEVFRLIGRGMETRQMAESLHVSIKTIETHRAHIKEKLQLKNATQMAQHAFQWIKDESGIGF